jgi:hypothetical protein
MKRTLLLTILLAVCAIGAAAEPEKRPNKVWIRTGPLGDTPKYVTDAFPLVASLLRLLVRTWLIAASRPTVKC